MTLTIFSGVLLMLPLLSTCSRILMIPSAHSKSHLNVFVKTGRHLKDVGGHQVDVLVEESRRAMVDKGGLVALPYAISHAAQNIVSDDFFAEAVKTRPLLKLLEEFTYLLTLAAEDVLQNDQLMSDMDSHHYDIVLIDGVDFARAFYIIPYILKLKYITLLTRIDPWQAGVSHLPSVEHLAGMGHPITEQSSLMDRIQSLITTIMIYRNMPPDVLEDSLITKYAPSRPKTTFSELFVSSEMWLTNLDTVCLDWPVAQGNHYRFVGGLALEQPKPLPAELDEFVRGARVGVIVLTFGSGLKNIPREMLEKMLHAFAQVEYRVIMRHGGDVPAKVPDNVKMMSWIPQADILSHPKTKIFITHGGRNGQQESMYHAVPMITIPMFGDQFYNAERVIQKGFGVSLDKDKFTSEDMLQAIDSVTKDKLLKNNIRKCSEKFRSLPSGHDTVLFWMEHVIRYGGDHLKPVALKVPIWKRFMLDILVVFILLVLVMYTLLLCCCYQLYKKMSYGSDVSAKKNA